MYLSIVLLGATHGFLFLPVLLSYVGKCVRNHIIWMTEDKLYNLSFEISGPVDKVGVRAQKTNSMNSSDEDSPRDSRDESSSILLDT